MTHSKPWSNNNNNNNKTLSTANKTLQKVRMSLLSVNFIVHYTIVTTYVCGPVGQVSRFFSSDTLLLLRYSLATNLAVLWHLKYSIPGQ